MVFEEAAPANLNCLALFMTVTCLNSGGHIDALFFDMAKAFHKVPHQCLCAKTSTVGK